MPSDLNKTYTLAEILKQRAKDGSTMPLIDVLSGRYPLLEEGYWTQANGDTIHEFSQIATESYGAAVRLNEGTPATAVVTKTVQEELMLLEDRMWIDTRQFEISPNAVQFRIQKEQQHFKGLIKSFHYTFFSKKDPTGKQWGIKSLDMSQIDGLGARYNKLADDSVVSLGGSGSKLNSIWIVKWGPDAVSLLYPRNVGKTLRIQDLMIQPMHDSNGNRFEAVMTKFSWYFGLMIADPRCVKRLCNISNSGASVTTSFDGSGTKGEEMLIDLVEALPGGDTSNVAIYVGPKVMAQIRKRINSKSNLYFAPANVWGREMITFQDIPVVRVDALRDDETAIA